MPRAASDAPGRPRMNPDEPGCSRAASDGEGAEKQHAKETTSSQPLRGTRSPGLHRAPVAEAPTGTADTRPWRNPTRHPGPLRTAPGENGSVAELPHREPPRNGSDGAAVTPAVAQPPTRPRRQGTQGQHPDAPDHSPTATPGPARTASGKNVLARGMPSRGQEDAQALGRKERRTHTATAAKAGPVTATTPAATTETPAPTTTQHQREQLGRTLRDEVRARPPRYAEFLGVPDDRLAGPPEVRVGVRPLTELRGARSGGACAERTTPRPRVPQPPARAEPAEPRPPSPATGVQRGPPGHEDLDPDGDSVVSQRSGAVTGMGRIMDGSVEQQLAVGDEALQHADGVDNGSDGQVHPMCRCTGRDPIGRSQTPITSLWKSNPGARPVEPGTGAGVQTLNG